MVFTTPRYTSLTQASQANSRRTSLQSPEAQFWSWIRSTPYATSDRRGGPNGSSSAARFPSSRPRTIGPGSRSTSGYVFDILKRPRLENGVGNKVLMIGGLKSSFSLNASCSTILILRLDLETLEWEEDASCMNSLTNCFEAASFREPLVFPSASVGTEW